MEGEKISFEDALNKAGFGLYSYNLTGLAGVVIIAFACIFYATVIIVPVSACDLNTTRTQQGMLAAGPIVGSILGAMVWGYLADQYGRKNVLMVSLVSGAIVNAIASLSIDWIMLLVLQFTASLMIAGHYSLAMTLLSESVPKANRNLVVMLVTSIFLLAQGVIAVLAMPIIPLSFSYHLPYLDISWNSWRLLLLIYSLPSVVSALWLYFVQESPKFLYSKGAYHRAMEVLSRIHRTNHLRCVDNYSVNTLERRRSQSVSLLSNHHLLLSLFRPPLLNFTVIMSLLFMFEQTAAFKVWLPSIAHRFVETLQSGQGISLTLCEVIGSNAIEDLAGDDDSGTPCGLNTGALLIVLAVSVMTSITNTCVTLVIGRIGRRNMAIVVTAITGCCGVFVNLVPNAIVSAILFVIQLLGLVVLGLYTAMCVALFPTHLRALAVTLTMTGSRIVAFISIQVTNYLLTHNCEIAFYAYGSVLAMSAVVASFLPNDHNANSPPHEILHEEETIDNSIVVSQTNS